MSDSPSLAQVEKVLEQFRDPETGRSVRQQKQVRDVQLEGNQLRFTLALTSHSRLLWDETRRELEELLRREVPGLEQVEIQLAEHHRPPVRQGQVGVPAKSVIAVGSGKGGVGKSTVAAVLATGLQRAGCKVGLLDADVYGPSIPHLLGVNQRPQVEENRIQPIVVDGLKVMSMGFLVPRGEAVVWRGPMLHGALMQFLRDTQWEELDYLVIDMPPGTGDVALSLSQLLPLTGAVVVCTPQDVALLDAEKAIAMFRKVNIPLLGMIENMSHFVCTQCGTRHEIFGHGGAQARAKELNVPFLGEVPLNVAIRIQGDAGQLTGCWQDVQLAEVFQGLCYRLVREIADRVRQGPEPPLPQLTVL